MGLKIEDCLPHRPPFLFVSGIADLEEGQEEKCYLDLRADAFPYLAGGVFPPLLVVEALGQAAAVLQRRIRGLSPPKTGGMAYLVKLTDFVFDGDAREGERILLAVRLRRRLGRLVLLHGEASAQGRRICAGDMTFLMESGD